MNLQRLRVFDMVVRTGSVTRAAERLHVTQPAITAHLKALEEHYEVSLFTRTSRRLVPTALGEHLAEISGRLFGMEEDAVDLLERGQSLRTGTLRLASDGPYLLVPMVKAFRQRFPGVHVSLSILNTRSVQEALLAERCDVAVQCHVEGDERLTAIPVARFELIVFVAQPHPWAAQQRSRIPFRELHALPVIVREPGSTTRRIFDEACAEAGIQPDYVIETTSRETVKEAVAAGLGIGIIAENEFRPDPRLWPVRLSGARVHFTDELLCLKRRRNTKVVHEFLAVAQDLVQTGSLFEIHAER